MQKYKTLVFDCDGVLLDSNRVKTEAFRTVATQFSAAAADSLVSYHTQNGGISRYRKFEYLLTDILRREADPVLVATLSAQYGDCVERDLLECAVAPGLAELRQKTAEADWMIVSGGDQAQLRRVFDKRGLSFLFDGGIYGSPTTKDEILAREIQNGSIASPAIYIGDSRYDHVASSRAGLDFIFASGWSEFSEWCEYCNTNRIVVIKDVSQLAVVLADESVGQYA
jgi:phosphoglycolate phosphatase-like HAD superfamily hydrolase